MSSNKNTIHEDDPLQDVEEIEVMPGVYLTNFRKGSKPLEELSDEAIEQLILSKSKPTPVDATKPGGYIEQMIYDIKQLELTNFHLKFVLTELQTFFHGKI